MELSQKKFSKNLNIEIIKLFQYFMIIKYSNMQQLYPTNLISFSTGAKRFDTVR